MSDEALLPCPFCGTEPKDYIDRGEGHLQYLTCQNSDCGIYGCGMLWDQWQDRIPSVSTAELEKVAEKCERISKRSDATKQYAAWHRRMAIELRTLISKATNGRGKA